MLPDDHALQRAEAEREHRYNDAPPPIEYDDQALTLMGEQVRATADATARRFPALDPLAALDRALEREAAAASALIGSARDLCRLGAGAIKRLEHIGEVLTVEQQQEVHRKVRGRGA